MAVGTPLHKAERKFVPVSPLKGDSGSLFICGRDYVFGFCQRGAETLRGASRKSGTENFPSFYTNAYVHRRWI